MVSVIIIEERQVRLPVSPNDIGAVQWDCYVDSVIDLTENVR